MLGVAEQFGDATYELRAGQHVLFEHGSLKEVVDNESSECGCPPVTVISVADAGVTSATPGAVGSVVAEKQHPFPAAVSAGLAPAAEVPQAPPGVVHAQVATALHYDAGAAQGSVADAPVAAGTDAGGDSANTSAGAPAEGAVPAATAPVTAIAQAPPPPAPPPVRDLAHAIGRFFKRLFGRR